jgi:hypothetical protein
MQINGRHLSCVKDVFRSEVISARGESMSKLQSAGRIVLITTMMVTAVVIPQRADAQAGSNVKADKQKIIVDEQPDLKSSQQKMKGDCERNHMKWDDTAKKCSK